MRRDSDRSRSPLKAAGRALSRLAADGPGLDLAAWAVSFGLLLYLPRSWGGWAAGLSWDAHRILWRSLWGAGFRAPLDPAAPLGVLRAGLPGGEAAFYLSAAAVLALAPAFLARLSDRVYGSRAAGLVGGALLVFGNGWLLAGPALAGASAAVWLGLAAAAVALFAAGRYPAAFALAGLSGLARPEGWALAAVLLAALAATDRPAFRPAYALALLAPVAWAAFDGLLAGDPAHSLRAARRSRELMAASDLGWLDFWPRALGSAAGSLHPVLAAAGLGGLGLEISASGPPEARRGNLALAGLLLAVASGSWVLAGLTGLDYPGGPLPAALLALSYYAAALPLAAARRAEKLGGAARARWGPWATAAFAAWVLAAGLLAHRTRPVRGAEETARQRHLRHGARRSAAGWLEDEWAGTGNPLLAGRSLPHYARALGPAASRRMHAYREVAADSALADRLERGVAVYVAGDPEGLGSIFRILEKGAVVTFRKLRFRPTARIGRGESLRGLIYRFERSPGEP